MPHINYGLINWSSATKTSLVPIKRCLKRAVRTINFAKFQDHSLPLFKKQNLFCFDDIVELEIGKFMYSVENKLLDSFFLEIFQKTNDRHTRCTRQATRNDYVILKTKLNIVRRSIRYVGAITWNTIPSEIKNFKKPYLAKIFQVSTTEILISLHASNVQCTTSPPQKNCFYHLCFSLPLSPSLFFLSFRFRINNVLYIF